MENNMIDIIDKNHNIALEASAGTGKTFQLSLRVASLLLNGVEPRDILCLTFTNKATAEMLERIVKTLKDLASGLADESLKSAIYPAIKEIAKKRGAEFSDEYVLKLSKTTLQKLLTEFSSLNIRTIDSYGNLILKIFPFETDIRPDFEILSEAANRILMEEAYAITLSSLLEVSSWRAVFKTLTQIMNSTPTQIMESVKTGVYFATNNYFELSSLIEKTSATSDELLTKTTRVVSMKQEILEKAKLFSSLFSDISQEDRKQKNVLQKYAKAKTIEELASINLPTEHSWFKNYPFTTEHRQLEAMITEVVKKYLLIKAETITTTIVVISKVFYHELEKNKKQKNMITYSDIQSKAYNVLNNPQKKLDKEYLYFRLDSNISHILIDEFQDTSLVQWEILEPLAVEAMSGIGQHDKAGSFFYVGDPKQNLYRFRGSTGDLFNDVQEKYSDRVVKSSLEINYRSDPAIVEFVNLVSNCAADSFNLPSLNKIYRINQKANDGRAEGFVRVETIEKKSKDEINPPFTDFTIRNINMLIKKKFDYRNIAILFPDNKSGAELKAALTELSIPAKLETSLKLCDTPIFNVFISLIRFLFFNDTLAFLNFALIKPTSFSNEISTNAAKRAAVIANYRKHTQLKHSSVFEKILAVLDAEDIIGRFSDEPDLKQILDIMANAAPNETNPKLFLEKFIESATDLQTLSVSDENAVTIMTINNSKGLQFDIVILPKLDMAFSPLEHHPMFMLKKDNRPGESKLEYMHLTAVISVLPEFAKTIEDERALIIEDTMNKLYVAMTRAKHGLIAAASELPASSNGITKISHLLSSSSLAGYSRGEIVNNIPHQPLQINQSSNALYSKPEIAKKEEIRYSTSMSDFKSTNLGKFAHLVLFFLNEPTDTAVDYAVQSATNRSEKLLSDSEIEDVRKAVKLLIKDEMYQKLYKGKVFKERSFAKEGRLYRIDHYSLFDNEIQLIDYKYAHFDDKTHEDYKKQIALYAKILSQLYDKPVKSNILYMSKDGCSFK